jgi:carboxymethylenebutenolidase
VTPVAPSPAGVPGAVTDPARVHAEDLTFAGAGGALINGYLARPATLGAGERTPGMIVIHEAGGLGEHIRDVVNRFANVGYVTLGVDLYTREGGPPPRDDPQAVMERLFSMSDAVVLGDLEGAARYLRSRPDASGKVGCIGFCMGGRYTLLFACWPKRGCEPEASVSRLRLKRGPIGETLAPLASPNRPAPQASVSRLRSDRLDAAVDCWGGFIDAATLQERVTETRPRPPLELAGQLHCPLMAAVGAEDHNPSPEVGERLRAALAQSPHETQVELYEGAGHAFFADYRPTYRPGPAAKLWERVVPFLERHLGAE